MKGDQGRQQPNRPPERSGAAAARGWTSAAFRQHFAAVVARALESADPAVSDLVREMIDILCTPYDRGGHPEARRALSLIRTELIEDRPARREKGGRE